MKLAKIAALSLCFLCVITGVYALFTMEGELFIRLAIGSFFILFGVGAAALLLDDY